MAAPPGPAGRLADDRVTGRPSPVATAIAAGALAALIGAAVAAGGPAAIVLALGLVLCAAVRPRARHRPRPDRPE
ncbi:hypothetical protein, partial [Marinitenerispora sediminis]